MYSQVVLKTEKFSKNVQKKKSLCFFFPFAESVELWCPAIHWVFKIKEKSVHELVSPTPTWNIEFGVCVGGGGGLGRYVLSLLDYSYFFPSYPRGNSPGFYIGHTSHQKVIRFLSLNFKTHAHTYKHTQCVFLQFIDSSCCYYS